MKKRTPTLLQKLLIVIAAVVATVGMSTSYQAKAEPTTKVKNEQEPSTIVAPLSERFVDADTSEVPDFQKHVVPLLGRLGCNGRACHGSFQGRGGFQLSLFGYDFKADHEALLADNTGRVDVDDVDESLILSKPTDADMHEGGKRYEAGSWQHHVLRRWIETGAEFESSGIQKLVDLKVSPSEIRFDREGEQVSLRAVAHWEDGTVEDVTELCRFTSNDDSVAEINEQGLVKSGVRGDSHVVVFYDNAVVPIPVMQPVGPSVTSDPRLLTNEIDRLVQNKLDKLGIVPSGVCTDAEFIRRVSLDMTGILPSAEEVRDFLADESTDKREQLIERLLESPGYAAWWATRFSDWTGNNEEQLNNVLPVRNAASRLWYEWLRERLENNMPYDEMIEGIVTADNRQPGESYREFCEAMTNACKPGNEAEYAQRDGLPLYWARRNFRTTEERAIGFAYTFLGVRIECAQCHKHPFDQWSKDDFEQFAKLFEPIRVNQNLVRPDARKERDDLLSAITGDKKLSGGDLRRAVYRAAQDGKTIPFGELVVTTREIPKRMQKAREIAKKRGRDVPPLRIPSGNILGQEEPIQLDKDPRDELMEWLRSPENPYFAKAIVNRVWSNYFGVGIVNPTDDMNLANPPVNAPLLDYLATELINHDFDLHWLHRTIVNSQTYQRTAETNATNVTDRTNFSHHIPRRLPAEVVYDAVVLATGSDSQASKLREELDAMAIAEGQPRRRNGQNFALEVFGQSIRESNCDCDRSDSPSLLQSIYLRNDQEMHQRLTAANGWVAQACRSIGVEAPKSAQNSRQTAVQRRAEGLRKRLVDQIRTFSKQPALRQERFKPQLTNGYERGKQALKQMGYDIPSLDSLLANPDSWQSLESRSESSTGNGSLASVIEEAYLRTLSRFPDPGEAKIATDYIKQSETPSDGIQSLLWALVNTKEFIITH